MPFLTAFNIYSLGTKNTNGQRKKERKVEKRKAILKADVKTSAFNIINYALCLTMKHL